jgi:hypothetical protein
MIGCEFDWWWLPFSTQLNGRRTISCSKGEEERNAVRQEAEQLVYLPLSSKKSNEMSSLHVKMLRRWTEFHNNILLKMKNECLGKK